MKVCVILAWFYLLNGGCFKHRCFFFFPRMILCINRERSMTLQPWAIALYNFTTTIWFYPLTFRIPCDDSISHSLTMAIQIFALVQWSISLNILVHSTQKIKDVNIASIFIHDAFYYKWYVRRSQLITCPV